MKNFIWLIILLVSIVAIALINIFTPEFTEPTAVEEIDSPEGGWYESPKKHYNIGETNSEAKTFAEQAFGDDPEIQKLIKADTQIVGLATVPRLNLNWYTQTDIQHIARFYETNTHFRDQLDTRLATNAGLREALDYVMGPQFTGNPNIDLLMRRFKGTWACYQVVPPNTRGDFHWINRSSNLNGFFELLSEYDQIVNLILGDEQEDGPGECIEPFVAIKVNWDASEDPESGVSHYIVYRDGRQIGAPIDTELVDHGVKSMAIYHVKSVNNVGLISDQSIPFELEYIKTINKGVTSK